MMRGKPKFGARCGCPVSLCLLTLVGHTCMARGQNSSNPRYTPNPGTTVQSSVGPKIAGDSPESPWDADPDLRHRMLTARRNEMKKHMSENAQRLLDLTRELETDLQQHEPTAADSKRLDDIAKLARAVRDQMRQ